MRMVVKYAKGERVKYISHLDFIRLIQRALRRANIPVSYSQGFNPHPRLAFASALAVGTTSEGEYLDIYLDDDVDPSLICDRMNEKLPKGIRFIEGRSLGKKSPSLMSLIERAKYRILMRQRTLGDGFVCAFRGFLSQDEILVTRTNRRGSRQVDIRPMIHNMDIVRLGEDILIDAVLSTGSKANLGLKLLVDALLDFAKVPYTPDLSLRMHRLDLYLLQNNKWITPIEIE